MARTQKAKSNRSRRQTHKVTKAHSAMTTRRMKALTKEQGEKKAFTGEVAAVLEEFKVVARSRYGNDPIYNRKPDNYCGKGETGGPWTTFWGMHSGGGLKEPYHYIFIEAPEEEAKIIFYNRFGHSPDRVSCTCCGADYSISESKTLAEATAGHRGCKSIVYQVDGIHPYTGEPNTDGPERPRVRGGKVPAPRCVAGEAQGSGHRGLRARHPQGRHQARGTRRDGSQAGLRVAGLEVQPSPRRTHR